MIYPLWQIAAAGSSTFPKLRHMTTGCMCLISLLLFSGCGSENSNEQEQQNEQHLSLTREPFGTTQNGQTIDIFTLTNTHGMEVKIANYGGVVVSLKVPDKEGQVEDVVLGFDSLPPYETRSSYFGALVGRYGNRIAGGKFTLDGKEYTLVQNNGPNHLHGGTDGFDNKVWQAEEIQSDTAVGVKLTYTSPDMEEGYPGNLDVTVTYTLDNDNALAISYEAVTDKKTIVNLTNHSYFNLTGDMRQDVLGHLMMINASQIVPVDGTLIPTGDLQNVEGTPFDFQQPTPIGEGINDTTNQQIAYGGGYDHCYVLDKKGEGLGLAATVYEPVSGRFMEVLTTEPGMQFYSGNFLNGSVTGKEGIAYGKRHAFCLETQHYPDSPNQEDFPSVVLNPGETYQTTTIYRFSVREEQPSVQAYR